MIEDFQERVNRKMLEVLDMMEDMIDDLSRDMEALGHIESIGDDIHAPSWYPNHLERDILRGTLRELSDMIDSKSKAG